MNLTIIRHGQPEHDQYADPPLSLLGQQQAEAVCAALAQQHFDVIIASSALRAQQTAAPLINQLAQPLLSFDELIEIDYGDPTYLRIENFRTMEDEAKKLWRKRLAAKVDDSDAAPFVQRVKGIVCQLAETYQGQEVLAFAHAGVINALVGWSTFSPYLYIAAVDYCSISRFSIRGQKARLRTVNETAHLSQTE